MGFVSDLLGLGETIGSLFSWLPEGMAVVIVAAITLLVVWFAIEIIIKFVGTFF